jgi:hypothetical protein
VRADSAFYSAAFTGAVRKAGAFFSVTVRMDPKVKAAIAAIPETAWRPIKYPRAIWDGQLACWVSDAHVAEAPALPMDPVRPWLRSVRTKSADRNWLPRSECTTTVPAGERSAMALRNAETARPAVIRELME